MQEPMEVDRKPAGKNIDEALYSRQLYVLGHEAMKLIQNTSVLICGMRAMGVEIAKNVILAGPRAVTLFDPKPALSAEIGCNFYLAPDRVGTDRAGAVLAQLTELNSYVRVSCLGGELTEEALKNFQVVVLCDAGFSEQLRVSDLCHRTGIKFISVASYGLFGSLFADYGESFVVVDKNGEQPLSSIVQHISQAEEGVVMCNEDSRHDLESGDFVSFAEVEGMQALNGCKPQEIKVISPYSFSVGDTSALPEYTGGGIVTECKMPFTIHFKSLRDSLKDPEFIVSDFAKFERPAQMLAAYQALDLFVSERGELPRSYNKDDAAYLVKLTEQVNAKSPGEKLEKLDSNVIEKLAFVCRGELMPMVSFLGGIAAQEVVKSCTGKFMPLRQFLFFDALECLPPDDQLPTQQSEYQEDRYSSQRMVFGADFQEKLSNQNFFVVGAGALGCELLKNFAMMGLGTGTGGKVTVTDMDIIERSNLNRQFLFRPWDMGKNKSSVAAAAARKMNSSLNIVAHVNKVGADTESVYDDKFFSTLSGVANALDNVDARMYMDRRCVYYRLPLLESGTLGTKGNVQVVIPFLTESYSSSSDPPEKEIAICTLKHFPNAIQHTLQWARDTFDGFFSKPGQLFQQFKGDENFMERVLKMPGQEPQMLLSELKQVLKQRPATLPDCVAWARLQFEEMFTSQIKQLLFNFPPEHTTSEGALFWSGSKRCPQPILYDSENDLHLDFVESSSLLYAECYSIPSEGVTRQQIQSLASQVSAPVFKAREGVKIATTDQETQENTGMGLSSNQMDSLFQEIKNYRIPDSFRLRGLDFEKDDDSNHHMDFITSCSNLRATNYQIETANKHKSKGIAGKIIPAIATTTTAVVGLVCLELYKLVRDQGCATEKVNHENYKNAFFNLALPFFAFSEPILAAKKKYYETEFSLWDRFEIDGRRAEGGEMTLGELLAFFKEKYQLEVTMLSHGVALVFAFFTEAKKKKLRMEMPISKALEDVTKKPVPPYCSSLVLEILCEDKAGEDVEVPYVKYDFR